MSDKSQKMGAELLVDGSFESAAVGNNTWTHVKSVGGWKSDSEIEVWGKNFYGLKATDGNKFAELDYDTRQSNIYQMVQTEAGAEYTFSFDYMKRPDSKAGSDTIEVFWNGKLVGTVDPTKSAWSTASFKVVGTGGDDKIEFREAAGDNDSYGGLLDNASLTKSGPSTAEKSVAEKVAADKAAAEKVAAEKAAAEKVAAEKAAAEKVAAEKAAAAKAAAEAKEKAEKAEKEAKEKAEKVAAEAKEKADKDAAEAKEKAEKEAKEHAEKADGEKHASDKSNNDDDKHDGRGHGDGDHNDDGHTDNGQGPVKAGHDHDDDDHDHDDDHDGDHSGGGVVVPPVVIVPPVVLPPIVADLLTLKVADVAKAVASEVLTGIDDADKMVGGAGDDQLFGKGGDDVLVGDAGGKVTAALDIAVGLVDLDASRTVSLTLSGMPVGAELSAGKNNGDGTWTLSVDDLKGLMVTADDGANFSVHVVATATDLLGDVLSQSGDVKVVFDAGNVDLVVGGKGNDVISGDAGDDLLYGGSVPSGIATPRPIAPSYDDNDVLHGGDGNDRMYGNTGDDKLYGDAGNDFVSGGKGNDFVSGGDGNDVVQGNSGDDVITGDAGDDEIVGGSGFDTLDYSMSVNGLVVDMAQHTAVGMGSDSINGIEMVLGSELADVMIGDSHDNVFVGNGGDDTFNGAKGSDTFTGGDGNDTFVWSKSDVYNFKAVTGWVDHVTDFQAGDKLEMTGFFKAGTLDYTGLVKVTDGLEGTTVSVKFGGDFHDVVVLDGVHDLTASDMMKAGMLLVA